MRRTHTYAYSGLIKFFPKSRKIRGFYFIVLYPFKGASTEFAIYNDEEGKDVYAEGFGVPKAYEEDELEPTFEYDFDLERNDPRTPMVAAITYIVSETILTFEAHNPEEVAFFRSRFDYVVPDDKTDFAKRFLSAFDEH